MDRLCDQWGPNVLGIDVFSIDFLIAFLDSQAH